MLRVLRSFAIAVLLSVLSAGTDCNFQQVSDETNLLQISNGMTNGAKRSKNDFPLFGSPADLEQTKHSKWAKYLKALYGSAILKPEVYPIDVSKLWVLSKKHLSDAGLELQAMKCPKDEYDVFTDWDWNAKGTLHIYHPPPFQGLSSHSLVEVSHCAPYNNASQYTIERPAYWLYYAPGSGVFYNVGNTKVFSDHADAVAELLPGSYCGDTECVDSFIDLYHAAAKKYDSIQFIAHRDQQCGGQGFEIVDLKASGDDVCSLPVSGGFGHCACTCKGMAPNVTGLYVSACLGCELDCSSPAGSDRTRTKKGGSSDSIDLDGGIAHQAPLDTTHHGPFAFAKFS